MRHAIYILLLTALALLHAGCVLVDSNTESKSELPWREPASWEGTSLGVPM